jgi:hypothetical protein
MIEALQDLALVVVLIVIAAVLLRIVIRIRQGGGSMTTIMLGATDEFLTEEKRRAAETIVNENAGKKFEAQQSGEPQTPARDDITISREGGSIVSISTRSLQKHTWRIHPHLDVEDLQPPVVLFSIFDEDPRAGYEERLKSIASTALVPGSQEIADTREFKRARPAVTWDFLFNDVPGNMMSMVFQECAREKTRRGRERVSRSGASEFATVVVSNAPTGRKWLVTRATHLGEKTVSWCLPVEVRPGTVRHVRLTKRNMTVLNDQ